MLFRSRPVSELHYPVCLGSGTFTVQLDGSAAGAGHCDWSPKSLTGEEGSGSTETGPVLSQQYTLRPTRSLLLSLLICKVGQTSAIKIQ